MQETTEAFGALQFLYTHWIGRMIRSLLRFSLPAKIQGWYLDTCLSKRMIAPFIKRHAIDTREFEKGVHEFTSFNDFFIRRLKRKTRPIAHEPNMIASPCDGKLLVIPNITEQATFFVKDIPFNI